MSPHTKTLVKWLRFTQLFLRFSALLGALGLLVCVIFIKPTGATLDWIIRVPAGVAILHCVYAIYHLSRASKGRTPASSASYMVFAAILDAGLIPFLVFTALMSRNEYLEPPSTEGHWQTVFPTPAQTTQVIWFTFIMSVINGSIHAASFCLSIYLALVFRKISALPPDMNPLEDNLTSRHKRNKSSVSTALTEPANRNSRQSELNSDGPRMVPFMTTRNDSTADLSLSQRRHRGAAQNSSVDLSQPFAPREGSIYSYTDTLPTRASERAFRFGFGTGGSSRGPSRPTSARPPTADTSVTDENWAAYPSAASPAPAAAHMPPELQHLRGYSPVPEADRSLVPRPLSGKYDFATTSPKPLGMNPPTPPASRWFRGALEARALRPTEGNGRPYAFERVDLDEEPAEERVRYGQLTPGEKRQTRVVSSGVDSSKASTIRIREVSGKVAEEGRVLAR